MSQLAPALLICLLATSSPAEEQLWKKHVVHSGAATMTAVAADFTGDGRPDVISDSNGKTRLFIAPAWKEVVLAEHPDIRSYIHSECFDIDGDGDQDYIGARYNPGLIVWLEQPADGATGRWTRRVISDQVHGIHGLLRGDVDGDGRLDLLATSAQPKPPYPDSLAWFRVPQNPTAEQQWKPLVFAHRDAPGLTHYLGVGDVNADGRLDAATGAKGGPQDSSGKGEWFAWWEAPQDPTGVWKKHLLPGTQPGATNIHPVDVNADGRTDFIASRGHGRGVVWFEAPDWKVREIHPTIREPHCLVVCDLDGDGDPDAATCAFGDEIAAWFENDGRGRFRTHVIGRNQQAYDIRAVDMDLDRDLDLLIAGRQSNNVVWYENPLR